VGEVKEKPEDFQLLLCPLDTGDPRPDARRLEQQSENTQLNTSEGIAPGLNEKYQSQSPASPAFPVTLSFTVISGPASIGPF
jgi:hypothetical protein